jgi:ketosteroid isomerase-like protein
MGPMGLHDRRAEVLRRGYAAFNRRDVEAALELFDPAIEWPDMLEGRTLHGRDEVRAYWLRQFELIRSVVEPREIAHGDELTALFVDQAVTEPASGDEHVARVVHLWTFAGEVPVRMEVFGEREHPTIDLFARFHEAQAAMYAGGGESAVGRLLAADAEWRVPGRSAIAGTYRGRDEVLAYFRRRRDLASGTFAIDVRDRLGADGGVVTLAHGEAELGGERERWGTAGVYRFADGLLSGGWLLPTDQEKFDRIWK